MAKRNPATDAGPAELSESDGQRIASLLGEYLESLEGIYDLHLCTVIEQSDPQKDERSRLLRVALDCRAQIRQLVTDNRTQPLAVPSGESAAEWFAELLTEIDSSVAHFASFGWLVGHEEHKESEENADLRRDVMSRLGDKFRWMRDFLNIHNATDKGNWSEPQPRAHWRRQLGNISPDTLSRWIDNGTLRVRNVPPKRICVNLDDLNAMVHGKKAK